MKALTIIIAIAVGIAFGMIKGMKHEKPLYMKVVVILLMSIAVILNLFPPISGTFADLAYFGSSNKPTMNVLFQIEDESTNKYFESNDEWHINAIDAKTKEHHVILISGKKLPDAFKSNGTILAELEFIPTLNYFRYYKTISVNPWITYPYIPGLDEKVRLINIHVPIAWISVLAYLFSMFYAIKYLIKKDIEYDVIASSSAFLGTIFAILATVTGMVWAKANWGSYWNWDPRETSILILLMIYFAYFALRMAIDKEEVRARLSSVYAIIAFITVPFFVFVMPRITHGLHPGSGTEENMGPVMSGGNSMLSSDLLFTFGLSFAAFTMLYFWLLNLTVRSKIIEHKLLKRKMSDG